MSSSETISPVYFGPDSSLYGCYHLAAESEQAPAVVICQPTGHEYERCHRAMRQLAILLSRKGISSLRFDYYATGDSAGDSEALNLSRMRSDTEQALVACRQKTNASRMALIGLRLGAALAAQLAATTDQIESLVLFAPAFDGSSLVREWREQQRVYNAKFSWLTGPGEADEILGFPVAESFRAELCRTFPPTLTGTSLKRVLILTGESDTDPALLNDWIAAFEQRAIATTVETMADPPVWHREPMDALVPVKTLRRIVAWLADD